MTTSPAVPVPLPVANASVRPVVASALAVVAVGFLVATLTLSVADRASFWWFACSGAVVIPAFVGVLIARSQPWNVIGWLLLFDAVNIAVAFFTTPYAHYGLVTHPGSLPGARWALLWDSAGWPMMLASLVAIVIVFPDGRLPSPRWRPAVIAVATCTAIVQVAVLFEPQGYAEPYKDFMNPLPSLPGYVRAALTPLWFVAFAGLFAAAWAMRVRLRRAEGNERLQLLWLTYGTLLIPLVVIACIVESIVGGRSGGPATAVILVAAMTIVPASVGIAVFRYHLFDIELILSRTLIYGTLTGCVVGGYLGLFLLVDRLVAARGIAGVVAAGLVALGFQPLRVTVQRRVSGLVYGDRSDPYAALTRLGHRLQDAPDPEDVLNTIVDDVAAALRLAYCAIELRRDEGPEIAAEHGQPGSEPRLSLPLSYQGEEIGALIAEPGPRRTLTAEDKALLGDLARQAGVAVHGVRVMADLQRSRERLVVTREEERLRLRRDLHDGLGPTLAALVLKNGLARESITSDPERTDILLRELSHDTQKAIADIRQLVYELRPPALDELGLAGALREQAALLSDSSGTTINIDNKELPENLPPAVEVAAYRIVAEALTNVARHAEAQNAHVAMRLAGGLDITVTDDGIGLDDTARAGVGLRSMRERATELGGSFQTGGSATRGFKVHVILPLDP